MVLLHGPRQAGKSTLAAALATGPHPATYVTLDDLTRLAAARRDPPGFVRSLPGAVVLDEIQRAPDLLLAIKREVDRDRRPGRFLLTGSANVLLLPGIADTLAGRMEIHNIGKRLAKAPKAFLTDTGLMLYLLGIDPERLATDPQITGPLLETFVATELRKQITWSRTQPHLLHFRTAKGHEVDFVLEARGGRLVGIEVKAATMVNESDFRGLHQLAQATGKRFQRGILLYRGESWLPFGPKMYALPMSAVWRLGAQEAASK